MKKFTVAALALTTLLSGSAFAHEAGEFFMRAGPATVRPTEGAGGTLGHLNGFDVSNNTQLGLTFTYMATDNIGVELLAATPFRHKVGTGATGRYRHGPPVTANVNGAVVLRRFQQQSASLCRRRGELHHLLR